MNGIDTTSINAIITAVISGTSAIIVTLMKRFQSEQYVRRITRLVKLREKLSDVNEKNLISQKIQYELSKEADPIEITHPAQAVMLYFILGLVLLFLSLYPVREVFNSIQKLRPTDFYIWLHKNHSDLYASCVAPKSHKQCQSIDQLTVRSLASDWVKQSILSSPTTWVFLICALILFSLSLTVFIRMFKIGKISKAYYRLQETPSDDIPKTLSELVKQVKNCIKETSKEGKSS